MRRIYPAAGPAGQDNLDDPEALASAYAYPVLGSDRAWLRANMVTSIDGAAQGPNGRSATLSSPGDRIVLALLRSLADVVLAGAQTVRTEHYGPADPEAAYAETRKKAGQPPTPPIAVVSRSLDLDPDSALFTEAVQRTIVLTVEAAPGDRRAALAQVADVAVVGDTSVDAHLAVRALADRGLQRILCEGGPHLLSHIAAADRLDELCSTVTPRLAGGPSARMIRTPAYLSGEWELGHVIEDAGTLLTRWRRTSR